MPNSNTFSSIDILDPSIESGLPFSIIRGSYGSYILHTKTEVEVSFERLTKAKTQFKDSFAIIIGLHTYREYNTTEYGILHLYPMEFNDCSLSILSCYIYESLFYSRR